MSFVRGNLHCVVGLPARVLAPQHAVALACCDVAAEGWTIPDRELTGGVCCGRWPPGCQAGLVAGLPCCSMGPIRSGRRGPCEAELDQGCPIRGSHSWLWVVGILANKRPPS